MSLNHVRALAIGMLSVTLCALGCRPAAAPVNGQGQMSPTNDAVAPIESEGPMTSPEPRGPQPASPVQSRVDITKVVQPADVPLTADEMQELDQLKRWCNENSWQRESDPAFRRQRPVGLMVLGADPRLTNLLPTSLGAIEAAAMCNWDIHSLLYLSGNERTDLADLRSIRQRITEINSFIDGRMKLISATYPKDAAPLRKLAAPTLYADKNKLDEEIDHWLRRNYVEIRSASEANLLLPDFRPPFGNIWFAGHGRSVPLPDNAAEVAPQFMVRKDEWLDISLVEKKLVGVYQAPVWLTLDLCRNRRDGKIDELQAATVDLPLLGGRKFSNVNKQDAEIQQYVNELEALRGNLKVGYFSGRGGVTKLFPVHRLFSVDDKKNSLLAPAMHEMLLQAPSAKDPMTFVFKNMHDQFGTATIFQQRRFTKEYFESHENKEQHPLLVPGTMSSNVVVYAAQPKMYRPQYPNLLCGGISHDAGGFTVPEVDGGITAYNSSITVIREQPTFDSDFKFKCKFAVPLEMQQEEEHQLVLMVSAEGADPVDAIKFTTGVYTSENRLLNSTFTNYDFAESTAEPILQDGSLRLIHVPLNMADRMRASRQNAAVAGFEVQTTPYHDATMPENDAKVIESRWKQGAALTIHGAYLVPTSVTDNDLKSELDRVKNAPTLLNMCSWRLPFHGRPEAVPVPNSGNDVVFTQADMGYVGLWGVSAEIYPKVYVTPNSRHMLLKVETDQVADEKAEIYVGVYSGTSILSAWKGPLRSISGKDTPIPLTEAGLAQEVVIAVRNHPGSVKLSKLNFEKRSSQPE